MKDDEELLAKAKQRSQELEAQTAQQKADIEHYKKGIREIQARARLSECGVTLACSKTEDRLTARPASVLTPELIAEIKEHKRWKSSRSCAKTRRCAGAVSFNLSAKSSISLKNSLERSSSTRAIDLAD
jgi:hypothetical protein